ncbi:MAG: hypothetical protein LBK41_02305 [Clostridiales bacterium]|jgi:aspartate 1-decarboxylase|nr:hypothetical protein [Clostridiales bacterium]
MNLDESKLAGRYQVTAARKDNGERVTGYYYCGAAANGIICHCVVNGGCRFCVMEFRIAFSRDRSLYGSHKIHRPVHTVL